MPGVVMGTCHVLPRLVPPNTAGGREPTAAAAAGGGWGGVGTTLVDLAARAGVQHAVGPGRYFSPRHMLLFNLRNEGSQFDG